MDLMGDIGANDQLISAREENKVLKAKVDELKKEVQDLKLSNAVLTAEVEMYRKDAALPSFSKMALGGNQTASEDMMEESKSAPMDFVASGNGTYPRDPAVSLPNLHGLANPLCCTLDSSDSILVVGGANSSVTITNWGCALAPSATAIHDTVSSAHTVSCPAPVICVEACSGTDKIIAAGCMDGSVCFIGFDRSGAWPLKTNAGPTIKYSKYVKAMAWSPSSNVLVTASADGTVQVSKVSLIQSDNDMMDDDDTESRQITIETIKSLHLKGAIETLCFVDDDTFCLYQRDTCYLSYFDLKEDCALTTYTLNGEITGGFDEHVSFAVMQLSVSPNGKYICAATDASRNIIMEVKSKNIVRDLYGHKNDGFSHPKVAWSKNGQYIFGNTQEDASIYVWDIASSNIVEKLEKANGGHEGQIRDIFSSRISDTVVTASFDKTVKVWLTQM